MIYPSIDKLVTAVGSKYLLVNVVSKRVKQIEATHRYQLDESEYKSKKNIGRALEEVSKGLIHLKEN
ncbi:MAG: DNA-directed RNA polymerase subunit omega [Bacilli bacterium]|nr:DNA-directed RNA polymerase subunit omega [Bacilli bacterium]